jgi:REP element-mobilizing transposase RayT
MDRIKKRTPPRLDSVFQQYNAPLYFVTFNTLYRRKLLARKEVLDVLVAYAGKNAKQGRAMGRFVIMPDHIHLFVRMGGDSRLSDFIRLLKQSLTSVLRDQCEVSGDIWQPGFFDRLLRHSENYSEKWHYVRENPVRAELVAAAEDWPWQGEIVRIDNV